MSARSAGQISQNGNKGQQIIPQVALVLGDFVTILLADLLASIATGGGTRFSSTEWYDLPLFVGCCLVLGLYSLKAFNHDQRLRVRLYAVVLFSGVSLGLAYLGVGALTTAHWAICAVLLFVVGFYVELLVLRLLQALRIWQAPKLVDFEGGDRSYGGSAGKCGRAANLGAAIAGA